MLWSPTVKGLTRIWVQTFLHKSYKSMKTHASRALGFAWAQGLFSAVAIPVPSAWAECLMPSQGRACWAPLMTVTFMGNGDSDFNIFVFRGMKYEAHFSSMFEWGTRKVQFRVEASLSFSRKCVQACNPKYGRVGHLDVSRMYLSGEVCFFKR